MPDVTRRKLLAGSLPILGAGAVALHETIPHTHPWSNEAQAATGAHAGHDMSSMGATPHRGVHPEGHANFSGGEVDHVANGFDPHTILRDFDWGTTRRLASGQLLREWTLTAEDKEIELAPGVCFTAWTYNGRVPGPTLRCREGDRLRITFVNASAHPHTIHFHGIHPSSMDGVPGLGAGQIGPGGRTVYEFDAQPAGVHLYQIGRAHV